MNNKQFDKMHAMMLKVLPLKNKKDYSSALSVIDDFLASELSPEIRSEVVSFRAVINEKSGDYLGAIKDLITAIQIRPEPCFARYVRELYLGDLCAKLGTPDDALMWYKMALTTSLKADDFNSGGSALECFLANKGRDKLDEHERALCEEVAKNSWKLSRLPGKPDLSDLVKIAGVLTNEEGKVIVRGKKK